VPKRFEGFLGGERWKTPWVEGRMRREFWV